MDFKLAPLQLSPGLVTSISPYDAKGRFVSGSNVRFYSGRPQKLGGWVSAVSGSLGGPARGVHAWTGLTGERYVAWGTPDSLWLMKGNTLYDITPNGMTSGRVDGDESLAWGQGAWGQGVWGGAATYFTSPLQPRTWTLGNWGEDLVACYRGGPLYVWQASLGPGIRSAVVPSAPSSILTFFVSETDRHLIALGANGGPLASGDDMTVAWCNRGDLANWVASTATTAGDKRLEIGSTIVAAVDTRLGYLILTDAAAYTIRYIGPPFIFSISKVGEGHDAPIGPNAIISKNGAAYWIGPGHVFTYDGAVRIVDSPVENEVFDHMNKTQLYKICAGLNRKFGEVTFFYPDMRDGKENTRYLSFNGDGWSLGQVARTSWLDQNVSTNYPIATDPTGKIYLHEIGVDAAGAPMPWHLETGEIEIGEGDQFMRGRKFIPDHARIVGSHTLEVETRRHPSEPAKTKGPFEITPTTTKVSVRTRARSVRLRWSGNALGNDWRLGQYRAAVRPHGARG